MYIPFLILFSKIISTISKITKRGSGSTWPGHIALTLDSQFLTHILSKNKLNVVFIVGTNGKTTTSRILTTIFQTASYNVFQNNSGANLLNGIASTLIANAFITGKLKNGYAIFEVDENNLPLALAQITPDAIIVLNLFRDQLDRYGELDSIASHWKTAFKSLPQTTRLILNADDPLVSYLGIDTQATVLYFGLHEKTKVKQLQHAADSIYCPRCHEKLTYDMIYYSHLGNWQCTHCGLRRPHVLVSSSYYPLPGTYNKYNTLGAVSYAIAAGINNQDIEKALHSVTPAFGRQETIVYAEKQIQIFLSKNPTSFNESLKTITDLKAKTILLVLNDRIPDGRDISWIWDVDFEDYIDGLDTIFITGDRVWDMALRLEYAKRYTKSKIKNQKYKVNIKNYEELENAVQNAVETVSKNETLFILPTYSAMLEVRKILTGKKIL